MKVRILLSILSLTIVNVAFSQSERPSAEIKNTSTPPVIDGVIDEVWAAVQKNDISRKFRDELPTLGEEGETWWKALWNLDGMYILINVTDDSFLPDYAVTPAGNSWEYDKPELYFDVNYVIEDGSGPNGGNGHYYFAPGFTEGLNDGTLFDGEQGQKYAFKVDETNYNGYTAEYFIPFSWLVDKDGTGIDLAATIGFDITVIDRDSVDSERNRAVWSNDGAIAENYINMDDCGYLYFPLCCGCDFCNQIFIQGDRSIETDNGKIQLTAFINPEFGYKGKFLWSVQNKTGRARINENGILEALMNGKVTVKAMGVDDIILPDYADITITNQQVTIGDLSVIPNGFFDLKDAIGHAEEWSGWGGEADSPMPFIVDGVAVATPVLSAENWQYQFSNSHVTALKDVDYLFKMKMWADAERTVCVDFESQNNISTGGTPAYTRYGVSTDPESTGQSEWTWNVSSEPEFYTWHVNFDRLEPSIIQKVQYMLGLSGIRVYIDSVTLVAEDDYDLLPDGIKKNPEVNNSFSLYPNPLEASNILNISLNTGNSRVIIYNSAGIIVKDAFIHGTEAKFDLSSCTPGLYFVKINNEVKKFVRLE